MANQPGVKTIGMTVNDNGTASFFAVMSKSNQDMTEKIAAKRAEKKKQESDALTDRIYALLDEDLITVDEILEELDDEEVTRNKVTARLGKLVKAGKVEKESVKVDGNRRMAYCLADKVDETEE